MSGKGGTRELASGFSVPVSSFRFLGSLKGFVEGRCKGAYAHSRGLWKGDARELMQGLGKVFGKGLYKAASPAF